MFTDRHLQTLSLVLACGLCAAACATENAPVGVVSHVLVLSDKSEDISSPEAWKKTYIKDGMSEQEKAIAIWKTVVRYRTQDDPPNELITDNVHDPLKVFHVYGYGMCCCASSNVEGLARFIGLQARGRVISAHSVPEVFYDNSWHLLDGSLMSYFIKPDGKLASVDEIRGAVRGWWQSHPDEAKAMRWNDNKLREFALNEGWKKGPELLANSPFYDKNGINPAGWHGWPSNMQEYDLSDKDAGVFEYGPSMGYQLNVQLRVGEKLTRNWFNKGLHVNLPGNGPAALSANPNFLGLQRKLGDTAPGRVGNGTLEYDLPLASGKFRSGVLTADNLACTAEDKAAPALHLKDAAQAGVLVVRMPSSYVYLGGELRSKVSVGAGGSVTVSFSDNQGLDWKEIAKFEAGGEQKVDLKNLVFRRYDYRVKVELRGAGTGLDSLKLTNDIQHSQAPLPTLLAGENKITFSAGPAEGTVTYEGSTSPANVKGKQLAYTDFHPVLKDLAPDLLRVGPTNRGEATFKLATPGELIRIRLDSFYRCRDLNGGDYWDVEASFDNGNTWKKAGRLDKAQPGCSQYITISDVPAGLKEALVRFSGVQCNTTCMFGLRLDADYKEPCGGFRPVKISYTWDENGQEKKDVHIAKTPSEAYTITCGAKALVKSFTVELAE